MRLYSIALAVICAASVARAQFPASVQPGARVRVWLPEPYLQMNTPAHRQLLRGTVDNVSADTLRVSVPGTTGTLSVPRAAMRRLEVSRGSPNRIASMLERGIGAAVVGALSFAVGNEIYHHEGLGTRYDSNGDAALAGAAWGGAIGGAIGLLLPTERWKRVRL